MIKIIHLRCESRGHFALWMVAKGLGTIAAKSDSPLAPPVGTLVCAPNVSYVEIGDIVQVPAVWKGSPFDGGVIVQEAIVDTAYHVDLRITDDAAETITASKDQTAVEVKGGKASEVAATPDKATTLMDGAVTVELFDTMVDGIRQAAGTKDTNAGVAIVNPKTPHHGWC